MQEEVVDIEDMTTGISIMDLGLNEFRLDLLDYIKHNPDIKKSPFGLYSVVPARDDQPEFDSINADCTELQKILSSITKTMKDNSQLLTSNF